MHPTLLTLPGLGWEIQSYGFMLGLALVLGWVLALRLAAADRLPAEVLGTGYVLGAATAILVARAAFLLQHPARWEGWRSLLELQPGGLAPFAGALVGLAVLALHGARHRVPPLAWFDCIAPAVALGVVLERTGAFLAGSGFGRYVDPSFPLAVTYPAGSVAYHFHRTELQALLPDGATESLTVHPSQLYGAALGLAGLALCVWLRRRRVFSGQVFLGFAIYWLLARALVEEWFRADAVPGVLGPFAPGQVAAILLAAALAVVYRTRLLRARRGDASVVQWTGGRWTPKAPREEV